MPAARKNRICLGLALVPLLVLGAAAFAAEPCKICSTSVTTNSGLAECFLEKYATLAGGTGSAVAVDLSDCPQYESAEVSRGIVNDLPRRWGPRAVELDTEFMLTHGQLSCLKARLEKPGLKLDPSARIDLDTCE